MGSCVRTESATVVEADADQRWQIVSLSAHLTLRPHSHGLVSTLPIPHQLSYL